MDTIRIEDFIDYCREYSKKMNELRERGEKLNPDSDMFELLLDEYVEMKLAFRERLKKICYKEEVKDFIDDCREYSKKMNELREKSEKLNLDSDMFELLLDEYLDMRLEFREMLKNTRICI